MRLAGLHHRDAAWPDASASSYSNPGERLGGKTPPLLRPCVVCCGSRSRAGRTCARHRGRSHALVPPAHAGSRLWPRQSPREKLAEGKLAPRP